MDFTINLYIIFLLRIQLNLVPLVSPGEASEDRENGRRASIKNKKNMGSSACQFRVYEYLIFIFKSS